MLFDINQIEHMLKERMLPSIVFTALLFYALGSIGTLLLMDNHIQGELTEAYDLKTEAERIADDASRQLRWRAI